LLRVGTAQAGARACERHVFEVLGIEEAEQAIFVGERDRVQPVNLTRSRRACSAAWARRREIARAVASSSRGM